MTATKPPDEAFILSDGQKLDAKEAAWLQKQAVRRLKREHGRSKFVPHQGAREKARRLKRAAP